MQYYNSSVPQVGLHLMTRVRTGRSYVRFVLPSKLRFVLPSNFVYVFTMQSEKKSELRREHHSEQMFAWRNVSPH